MKDDLEAALRRMVADPRAEDRGGASSRAETRIGAAAAAEASARLVADRTDRLEFCAGLAACRGAGRRRRARHLDRPVQPRHAHRRRSRSGAGRGRRGRPTTCSISIWGYGHDDDHGAAGPLRALVADRLARAQSAVHRNDRHARGAPCARARAAGRDRAAAHRGCAHRAARAPLPAADAEKLRAAFRAREAAAEGGREGLNRAFERIQAAMRAEPFEPRSCAQHSARPAPCVRPTSRRCRRSSRAGGRYVARRPREIVRLAVAARQHEHALNRNHRHRENHGASRRRRAGSDAAARSRLRSARCCPAA